MLKRINIFRLYATPVLLWFGLAFFAYACNEGELPTDHVSTPYNLVLPSNFPKVEPPQNNPLTVEGVELGRYLFYDPILSKDNKQACVSCHSPQNAFVDKGVAFSLGVDGLRGKRNSMPLFNLLWQKNNFLWDGRANTLQEQVLFPIQDPIEMHETLPNVLTKLNQNQEYRIRFAKAFNTKTITAEHVSKALEQFLLTLISANSKFDQFQRGEIALTPSETRGLQLFQSEFRSASTGIPSGGDCFHCHGNVLFTTGVFSNNGLDSVFKDNGRQQVTGKNYDKGKFKIPSLRNLAFTAPYMHDGRFKTLQEVIQFYDHQQVNSPTIDPVVKTLEEGLRLSDESTKDLLAFLNTLNDTSFVENPNYQKPIR